MTANHQRQSSYPPPYESYNYHDDESVSPTNTSLPQPYLNNDNIYEILPHYTSLPAFNSPRRYSRRLRRLVETREKSLFLTLQTAPQQQSYQQLAVVDLDEKSANCSSANLLGGLPCDEESQYTHHQVRNHNNNYRSQSRRRRSSTDQDNELSWWTFIGLAAVLFMVVASCSVFVGWSTGLFEGNGGLVTHMRYSHSVMTVWGSPSDSSNGRIVGDMYGSRLDTIRTEGCLLGEMDDDEQTSVSEKLRVKKPVAHADEKQSAREEVQKRSARRRKGGKIIHA